MKTQKKKSEPQMVFEPMTLYDLVEFSFGAKKHIIFYFYKKRLCKRWHGVPSQHVYTRDYEY